MISNFRNDGRMSKIILALDGMKVGEMAAILYAVQGQIWGVKLHDLLYQFGSQWITSFGKHGLHVMADPKLHDIPATVTNTVRRLADAGANMITVHASSGLKSLKAAVAAAGSSKIIAVTALTSMTDQNIEDVYRCSRSEIVHRLASLAEEAGCHGIVCSGPDLDNSQYLREMNLIKVVPGFRPDGLLPGDDQVHVGVPVHADYVVIGRPITGADSPGVEVKRFNELLGDKK